MVKYVYDKKTESFVPKRPGLRDILLASLKYGVASLLVALLFYGVFALVFSTDRERDLERENRMLAEEYAGLSDRLDRLDDVVGNLQVRDREIYRDLFSADPPNYITEERDTLLSGAGDLESMREEDLVWDTYAVTKRAESAARQVTAWLAEIDTVLQRGEIVPTGIPSLVPVAGFSPLQTGASVGRKVNPFYKTVREHTGLDIVAPIGTPVRCSADGWSGWSAARRDAATRLSSSTRAGTRRSIHTSTGSTSAWDRLSGKAPGWDAWARAARASPRACIMRSCATAVRRIRSITFLRNWIPRPTAT